MDKRRAVRWAVFLVLLIPVVYLAMQLVPLLFRGYETQTAVEATLADGSSGSFPRASSRR